MTLYTGISHTGTSGTQPDSAATGYDSISSASGASFDAVSGWISAASQWAPIINLPSVVDGSTTKAGGPRTTSGVSQNFTFSSVPSGNCSIIHVRSGGSVSAQVRFNSTGKFQLVNGTSAVGSESAAMATNTEVRLEHFVDGAAGTQRLDIYKGAQLTGGTPTETLTGAWTSATVDQYRQGILNNTTGFGLRCKAPTYSNTTARIGGAAALAVVASADSSTTAVGYAVAVTGAVSNATGTPTYAWTHTGSGSFASSTSLSTTYTATSAGTHTLTLSVTDSTGTVSSNVAVVVVTVSSATAALTTGWTLVGDGLGASDAGYWQGVGTFEFTLAAGLTSPGGDLLVPLRLRLDTAGSLTVTPTLRDGGSVVSTGNTLTVSSTSTGGYLVTFPAADLTGITSGKWAAGTLRVRLVAA